VPFNEISNSLPAWATVLLRDFLIPNASAATARRQPGWGVPTRSGAGRWVSARIPQDAAASVRAALATAKSNPADKPGEGLELLNSIPHHSSPGQLRASGGELTQEGRSKADFPAIKLKPNTDWRSYGLPSRNTTPAEMRGVFVAPRLKPCRM
jgi:hypothetical protein